MAEPIRPGWYPKPGESGLQQWWNGVSWSEVTRTNAGVEVETSYLDAARAAVPESGTKAPASGATFALIVGIISIFFNPFLVVSVIAFILSVRALRRSGASAALGQVGTGRGLGVLALLTSLGSTAYGLLNFARDFGFNFS
jgi:hypothetical protein